MRGEVKTLLEFFKLIGHVEVTENYSQEIKTLYSIKLTPDQSVIPLMMLERLKNNTGMRVNVWFFNNNEENENQCNIELEELA